MQDRPAAWDQPSGRAELLPCWGRTPRSQAVAPLVRRDRRIGPLVGTAGLILLAAGLLAAAARVAVHMAPAAGMFDLRVIGASNRPADQAVKLQVRDAVLAVLAPGLVHATSERQAQAYVAARLPAVAAAAAAVAGRTGQHVRVRLGPAPLPARRIGLLAFAAGRPPALVVTLGAGLGHNWWTVLFPPLAFVTVRGELTVVGPAGAAEPVRDLSAAQRTALLAWVAGQTHVSLDGAVTPGGPSGAAGVRVQVRFAIWNLLRRIPWGPVQRGLLSWLGAQTTPAGGRRPSATSA